MWKYILIIAFVLFAIREINLMNESLYVAPDTHKIVVEDKSVIGKVVKVIGKLEKMKSHTPQQTTTPVTTEEKHASTKKASQSSRTLPSLSRFEEQNNSTAAEASSEKPSASKLTLQQLEEEARHATHRSRKVPPSLSKQTVRKAAPVTQTAHAPQRAVPASSLSQREKHSDTYRRAEERVNAILEQMRSSGQ